MPIIACGISHKTAPVALREKVVFPPDKLALYLQDLAGSENLQEAVLLSTCNRSELYCETDHPMELVDWFCRQHQVARDVLLPAFYFYEEMAAVRHIMEVACGLDSMVPFESQILGQMKTAFSEACAAGTVGPLFNRLFQQVFAVAKDVRTNTTLGACPVSVSSAAVRFMQEKWGMPLSDAHIVLLGAGLTIELALRHLLPLSPNQVTIVSRQATSAKVLAEKNGQKSGVRGVGFDVLPAVLETADIVIAGTASPQPVITLDMLAARRSPLMLMDIAVPRDIDAQVATLPVVQLYSIDDLRDSLRDSMRGRAHAAEKAREEIQACSEAFMRWLVSVDQVTATIRSFREQIEALCAKELAKSRRHLQRGDDPEQVLALFARALTQKLLHMPSVQLREAGIAGRFEMLELARELFAIPERRILAS